MKLRPLIQEARRLVESEVSVDDRGYAYDDEGNSWYVGTRYSGHIGKGGSVPGPSYGGGGGGRSYDRPAKPKITVTPELAQMRLTILDDLESVKSSSFLKSIRKSVVANIELSDAQKNAVDKIIKQVVGTKTGPEGSYSISVAFRGNRKGTEVSVSRLATYKAGTIHAATKPQASDALQLNNKADQILRTALQKFAPAGGSQTEWTTQEVLSDLSPEDRMVVHAGFRQDMFTSVLTFEFSITGPSRSSNEVKTASLNALHQLKAELGNPPDTSTHVYTLMAAVSADLTVDEIFSKLEKFVRELPKLLQLTSKAASVPPPAPQAPSSPQFAARQGTAASRDQTNVLQAAMRKRADPAFQAALDGLVADADWVSKQDENTLKKIRHELYKRSMKKEADLFRQ